VRDKPHIGTDAEKKIFDASHGSAHGMSYEDIIKACEKRNLFKSPESTVYHIVPQMVRKGALVCVSDPGRKPKLFKPYDEVLENEEGESETGNGTEELDLRTLADLARKRGAEIISHIDENGAWQKSRRIKAICRNEISPFIETILVLRDMGYSVSAPCDYAPFWSKGPRAFWDGLTGRKDVSGPISLCRNAESKLRYRKSRLIVDIKGKDVVHPNLLEWRAYLAKVVKVLESESPSQRKKSKESVPRKVYLQSRGPRYDRLVELPLKD